MTCGTWLVPRAAAVGEVKLEVGTKEFYGSFDGGPDHAAKMSGNLVWLWILTCI